MMSRPARIGLGLLLATHIVGSAYLAVELVRERASFARVIAAKDARLLSLLRERRESRGFHSASSWPAVLAALPNRPPDAPPPVLPAPCSPSGEAQDEPDAEGGPGADGVGDLTPEEAEAAQQFEVDQLEHQLRDEPVDERWATDASSRIRGLNERSSVTFRVGRVDCRSTVCRVELSHRGDRSLDEDFHSLVAASPLEAAIYISPTKDPRSPSVAYLSRRGYQLSAFQPRPPTVVGPQPAAPPN